MSNQANANNDDGSTWNDESWPISLLGFFLSAMALWLVSGVHHSPPTT